MIPSPRSVSRAALVAFAATVGCTKAVPPVEPRFVAELMQNQYGWIRSERISPPVAARITAYAAGALFEALATGSSTLRSLAGQLAGLDSLPAPAAQGTYDKQLIGLVAQRTVLDSLYREGLPQTKAAIAALFDSLWAVRVGQGIDAATAERSRDQGLRLGLAVVAWAGTDGFDTTRTKPWTPPVGPQYWVNSSGADEFVSQNQSAARDFVALDNPGASLRPGQASERSLLVTRPKPSSITTVRGVNPTGATEPWWGSLRTFGLSRVDECPIQAPASFSTAPGSELYREAMAVYEAGKTLDDEKHQIVLYWADNPGQSGTPTGHWLSIGSQMVSQLRLDADRAAELFALVSMAQADAFIASWKVKYETMVIRPNTYINRVLDPKWETDIITPPFPEYPSGHSVQSGAASAVMTKLLGDRVAFDDSTNLAIGHAVRRFDSFLDAADEAAMSRLYGGIHYPMAITRGNSMGRCIGERVVTRLQTRRGA
jgi:hypothetical protein